MNWARMWMAMISRGPEAVVTVLSLLLIVYCESTCGQVIRVENADLETVPNSETGRFELAHWKSLGAVTSWNGPLGPAVEISSRASVTQAISLTPLEEKQLTKAKWGLLLAVDVLGTTGRTPAAFSVTLRNGKAGSTVAAGDFTVNTKAARSMSMKPRYFANSIQPSAGAEKAFDNDPKTIWHTNWSKEKGQYPHFLAVDFGATKQLTGFNYLPRQTGSNGVVDAYELQVSRDGVEWMTVAGGRFSYRGNTKKVQLVNLRKSASARFARLVCQSEINKQHFASCAELAFRFRGDRGTDRNMAAKDEEFTRRESKIATRVFLTVAPAQAANMKELEVEIKAGVGASVVIDRVHLCHLPDQAKKQLLGKANGHNGPDLLGAGSYGLDGMMVHQQIALPVMKVHENSPASRAGLQSSDVIVGVNGEFLPPGDLAPGFNWYHNSHEALLGRAAMTAFSSSADPPGIVELSILRAGQIEELKLQLQLPQSIADDDFMTSADKLSILNKELIAHVLRTQRDDGSWRRNPIHTSLGGLALLSTGDTQYAKQIKAAANWLMARHATPDTGFYWFPSWAGIFLGEYYLATGDERALPVMQRHLRVIESAFHTSKWGTPTLGHGPRGLPYGNKSLVAPAVHVLVFETLARRCGIRSNIHEKLWPFMRSAWSDPKEGGHGGLGYNASYKDLGEFFSRSGLLSLALKLRGERPDMQEAMVRLMHQRHPWIRNSHAYGEPGGLMGLIGMNLVDQEKFHDLLRNYQWWFALSLETGYGLHFTMPHMGAPYMESPELINNGYAIVTNAHRRTLHMTGSQATNWLDVSNIPVPLTDVMILQQLDGKVQLKCQVPGPKIYYTTDGSPPTPQSPVYEDPFPIGDNMIVHAVAVEANSTATGVATRQFGIQKKGWRVVSANGHVEEAEAKERAARLFDGDEAVCWVTDVGEGSSAYPFEVVIDLGDRKTISTVETHFPLEVAAAKTIEVSGANSPSGSFRSLGQAVISKYQKVVTTSLETAGEVQFLRISFTHPLKDGVPLLMIGEIELR